MENDRKENRRFMGAGLSKAAHAPYRKADRERLDY
jgi:hypothetical protein